MIKYSLSNRQQKELLIRGQTLRIAIPIHVDGDDHDWLGYARRSMIADHAQYISGAEPDVLWTDLSHGIGGTGVSSVLGRIVDYANDARLPVSVEVVICELTPPVTPRGAQPLQWPGRLEIDGVTWPPPAASPAAPSVAR